MEKIKENLKKIYSGERGLFVMQILLFLSSMVLFVFSIFHLSPSSSVVKVGYGDIGRYQGGEWSSMSNSGGYHDGSWLEMLAFPIMAVIFGILHNLVTVRLYERKGAAVAKVFMIVSLFLVAGTFLVLVRLLGEA